MKPAERANLVAAAMRAYRDSVVIPPYDDAAVRARANRSTVDANVPPRRGTRRFALALCACVAVVVALAGIPSVLAGVERIVRAFTIEGGRTAPMTIRPVSIERARRDMPFTVIVPPQLANARSFTIAEATGNDASAASLLFQYRLRPGGDVTIVERKAGAGRLQLISVGADPDARGLPAPPTLATHAMPRGLHGLTDGRAFVPISWVARGTQIVLLAAPGAVSAAETAELRRQMSRVAGRV